MNSTPASLLYIGSYAPTDAAGIHQCSLDHSTGRLSILASFPAGANPSFLALSPDSRTLFAVNEISADPAAPGRPADGAVSAFAVDPQTHRLRLLNRQPSHGIAPCHLATDCEGRFLFVANYVSGTLAVYPIETDGRLSPACQVVQHEGERGPRPEQEGPHAHSVTVTANNRFVLSCDLGIDRVFVYRFDAVSGRLERNGEAVLPSGAGPRHLEFHPVGRFVYVINELDSTMAVFGWDAETGVLTQIQMLSTLPVGYAGANACAEVCAHPNGRFVYGSNRGHDSIVIFRVEETTGCLELVGHESTRGEFPRSFAIDPTGEFLLAANQGSDAVLSFGIDGQSGRLRYLHSVDVPRPVCVVFSTDS